jgi:hypothetical protein
MEWLRCAWNWVVSHPWLSISGLTGLCVSIVAIVRFLFELPELLEKRKRRNEEKRIKHYCQEIRRVKALIERGELKFETTQQALGSIVLLKKGDETLRNEAYVRFTNGRC